MTKGKRNNAGPAQRVAIWERLRTSLWFVPALLTTAAALAAWGAVTFDRAWGDDVGELPLLYDGGPETARVVLSTVASSMITVGGVTISITLVALSLASQQYGPRLVRTFMRHRSTQFAIGTFIAVFVYGLLVLRSVEGADEPFVPAVGVTLAILLAVLGAGVFINFIHHIGRSIQAEHVVADVAAELDDTAETLYPEQIGEEADEPAPARLPGPGAPIRATSQGYVQAIGADELFEAAERADVVLRLSRAPGDFVARGEPLAEAWPPDRHDAELDEAVCAAFVIGAGRTPVQDARHALGQLVEVALRALSPSINDPYTAISCIDALGAALAGIAGRREAAPRREKDGVVRVLSEGPAFRTLVAETFGPLRNAARGHRMVVERLLVALQRVERRAAWASRRAILREEAALVVAEAEQSLPEWDLAAVRARAAAYGFGGAGDKG